MTSVVVLDYGSGNLRSAQRALERVGADVTVTSDFDTAMADDAIRHVAISRALRSHGHDVSEKAIAAHRRGTCACARR